MKLHTAAWRRKFVTAVFVFSALHRGTLAAQAMNGAVALHDLLKEAAENNPAIRAAAFGYQAARNIPQSAGALPDTHVEIQNFSVGSPKPFAGYTNSNFAYIGIGASQEIPYPGKRRLRSEAAQEEAEAQGADVESTRRAVFEQIKTAYYQLGYLQQADAVLRRDGDVLNVVEKVAEAHYRTGQGNEQDVLKAQLQKTKLLQGTARNHQEEGRLQAQIKQWLNRQQISPDIVAEPLSRRTLPWSADQLQALVRNQNPQVRSQQEMLTSAGSQVRLARKEFRPDFNIQYMYQNNDRQYRDYYMLTFGINLPNRGRRRAELAEAEAKEQQAKQTVQDKLQQQLAQLQEDYVVAQTSGEQIDIYKQGLLPQAQATFQAALAGYQTSRQDFQTILGSFLDVLNLQIDYQQQLADHESALARIEAVTGVTLQ